MKRILAAIVMAMFVLTSSGTSFALRAPATAEAKGKATSLKGELRAAAPAAGLTAEKVQEMIESGEVVSIVTIDYVGIDQLLGKEGRFNRVDNEVLLNCYLNLYGSYTVVFSDSQSPIKEKWGIATLSNIVYIGGRDGADQYVKDYLEGRTELVYRPRPADEPIVLPRKVRSELSSDDAVTKLKEVVEKVDRINLGTIDPSNGNSLSIDGYTSVVPFYQPSLIFQPDDQIKSTLLQKLGIPLNSSKEAVITIVEKYRGDKLTSVTFAAPTYKAPVDSFMAGEVTISRPAPAAAAGKTIRESLDNLKEIDAIAVRMRILLLGEGEVMQGLKEYLEDYYIYGEHKIKFADVTILPSASEEEQEKYDLVIARISHPEGYLYALRHMVDKKVRHLGMGIGTVKKDLEMLKANIDSEIDLWLSL